MKTKPANRADILRLVIEILAEYCGIEKVSIGEDTHLEKDLELDSLDILDIESRLEDALENTPINLCEGDAPTTVREIVDHIQRKLK